MIPHAAAPKRPAPLDLSSALPSRPDSATTRDELVKVGLFRGPATGEDEGFGIRLDDSGTVVEVLSGGIAARWGEFKVGDTLVAIGEQRFVPGSKLRLSDYVTGPAVLCTVHRRVKSRGILSARTTRSRFATQKECVDAWERAGDYIKCISRR